MPRKISESKKKLLEQIYQEYLENKDTGYYDLSIKYKVPYSTLRRYILQRLKEENKESEKEYVEFPYEGFECIQPGDTFSWVHGGTVFRAEKKIKVGGEIIWLFTKVNERNNKRHFYPETLEDACEKG